MIAQEAGWFDEDAGPLARPYTLTRGRTQSDRHDLGLVTLVVALRNPQGGELDHAHERILDCCQKPVSVAEVAAGADLPLGVVKVLISDLIDRNYMIYRSGWGPASTPGPETLQKVLDGFRKL